MLCRIQQRITRTLKDCFLVRRRLDVLVIVLIGLNVVGIFIIDFTTNVPSIDRRLELVTTEKTRIVAVTLLPKSPVDDEEDRKESLRRLTALLGSNDVEGVNQQQQQQQRQLLQQKKQQQQQNYLPRWSQDVVANYGAGPIVLGLDSCHAYQQRNRQRRRRVMAPAGMFHTGTSLLMTLLEDHCRITATTTTIDENNGEGDEVSEFGMTERTMHVGLHGQVPWGKHNPASFREDGYSALQYWGENQIMPRDAVLPIVTIAHPYHWMINMCRQPFTASWKLPTTTSTTTTTTTTKEQQQQQEQSSSYNKPCPYAVHGNHNRSIPVTVKYGNDVVVVTYESMAHLWNKWNRDYFDSRAYPRLMIRYEDLLFYPDQVVQQICQCAGGVYHYHHSLIVDAAATINQTTETTTTTTAIANTTGTKQTTFRFTAEHYLEESVGTLSDGGGGNGTTTMSLADAWSRYGRTPTLNNSTAVDQAFFQHILDKDMLQAFHYNL